MKIEVNTEEKTATIEGVVEDVEEWSYDSSNDIRIQDGSDIGESVARWLVRIPFVKKGKKVVIQVMVFD